MKKPQKMATLVAPTVLEAPVLHATEPRAQAGPQTLIVKHRIGSWKLRAVIVVLLTCNLYLLFTAACMVPDARNHFFQTLISPDLRYFLAR